MICVGQAPKAGTKTPWEPSISAAAVPQITRQPHAGHQGILARGESDNDGNFGNLRPLVFGSVHSNRKFQN